MPIQSIVSGRLTSAEAGGCDVRDYKQLCAKLGATRVDSIANRHMFNSTHETRAHPLNRSGQFDHVDVLRQLTEHCLQLQASQVRTQAIMLADAESQMWIRLAPYIKAVGIFENFLIAIG